MEEMVGPPITLMERLRKGSIGSHRMIIEENSPLFDAIFEKAPGIIYTNLELRPKGVLFHFNIKYTRYSWIIPFHQLVIFSSDHLSIHSGEDHIRIRKDQNLKMNRKIISKLLERKAEYLEQFRGPN